MPVCSLSNSTSAPGRTPHEVSTTMPADQIKTLPLESIFGALGDYRLNYARGFTNTRPGERVIGRALTMRFLPPRPDLVRAAETVAKEADWDRRYYAR